MRAIQTAQFIAKETVGSLLYFPIWWYTEGAMKVLRLIGREVGSFAKTLRIRTLFRFLLKPMFGQTDIWGRIISFGVRIVHAFVLLFVTIFYTIFLTLLFLVWIALPPLMIAALIYHFNPLA